MTPAVEHKTQLRYVFLAGALALAAGAGLVWASLARSKPDLDSVWRQAQADLQTHRFDAVEAAVARLGRERPPTPLDWMLRAQLALARERPDQALEFLAKIPDDHSIAPQARLMAGQIELRRNRARRAEAFLREAIRLDPKALQPHRELIYLYGLQLRRPELDARFRALAELTTLTFENVFHWSLVRNTVWEPLESAENMKRFLEADPGDRWSRIGLAENLLQLGRKDESESVLAVLPESDPEARALRARIALERGDDRKAEALLADGPSDHPVLARLRGRFALAHGAGAAALRHFRAAQVAEPDNRDTIFGLANALTMLGESKAAAPLLIQARDYDRFGSLMQRAALANAKDDPKLLKQLGAASEAIHRLPEARAWYKLVIASNPLDTEAQHALYRLNQGKSQ